MHTQNIIATLHDSIIAGVTIVIALKMMSLSGQPLPHIRYSLPRRAAVTNYSADLNLLHP